MSQYIKSHSNYVLRKMHQAVSDGTAWERDMTTIGGVNQFSPGQTPIYKSSNFIITVRNDGRASNQYNESKWKENESGDTWTMQTLSGITSDFEEENDLKIVLKQDYYDFCDFAYYGSLSELFRGSVNDVLMRFPGELYITNKNAYYTVSQTVDSERISERKILGGEAYHYVSNPFGIDIHSAKKPIDGKAIKYFAEEGYKNYEVFVGDETEGSTIEEWSVQYYDTCKVGEKVADIKIDKNCRESITIYAYIGDGNKIIYLSADDDIHIRPLYNPFYSEFYNECNALEKILLNPNTTPKYKATFSVIKDNENGFYREMEDFIFPTSYGGYNVDADSYGFTDYTIRLAEIGSYYDELFTDNMWRSMTHEAIKNFDWTFTREFGNGDEEEYVHGGEKIQKALRVFAREFDEILAYINNIKNNNRITYDERNNIPNYFLIDEVANKGWDVCMTYPFDLEEYYFNDDGTKIVLGDEEYNEDNQLSNAIELESSASDTEEGEKIKKHLTRQFSQNTTNSIQPYRKELLGDYQYGYFILPCGLNDGESALTKPCQYTSENTCNRTGEASDKYAFKSAEGSGSTYYDEKSGKVLNRMKAYSDNVWYTYFDANNEFMKRLAINSPYIMRHKGTIEGIEMILGMFGMKSKRWLDRRPSYVKDCEKKALGEERTADYEIMEYSSFADRIEEQWDAIHQMYRIDWINSTKTIVYDYRSTSNYTNYGAHQDGYVSYQGIPVVYRYEPLLNDKPYIKVGRLNASEQVDGSEEESKKQEPTSDPKEAFVNAETNEPVRRRYLYPNFSTAEKLDGNPYFQMNGGWLSKTLYNSGSTNDESEKPLKFNFQFDINDNITSSIYNGEKKGDSEEDTYNKPIFKETLRNIRRVNNIEELLSIPSSKLEKGSVCYVTNIDKDVALINNQVYKINYEYSGSSASENATSESTSGSVILRYILLTKNDEYIQVGDDRFFDDKIYTYNKYGVSGVTNLLSKPSGFELNAYILDEDSSDKPRFICQADEDGYYTIDSFVILDEIVSAENATHYFIIDDPYYSDRITSGDSYGWRMLLSTDDEYIRINTITNYYGGNNPHNGNMNYDNGHEYFTYFNRLFKDAIDEDLFDERCYENFFLDLDNEITNIGFSGLIDSDESICDYEKYISGDTKIHYFGNYYKKDSENDTTSCTTLCFYGDDKEVISAISGAYKAVDSNIKVEPYILNDDENMIGGSPYSKHKGAHIDEVTNQIMNNKRFTIRFNLHNPWFSKQGECELKYIDSIVMNYLTQMIPSSTIVDIQYVSKGKQQ